MLLRSAIFVLILYLAVPQAFSQIEMQIKDLCRVSTVRDNQLVGYGLVVGLDRTGDSKKTFFTDQSIVNMLDRIGITVDKEKMNVKNTAAVIVTGILPPFARSGDRIDITCSSLGDAKSLEGGVLLQTPLRAANGRVYAVAQGPITIGGLNEYKGRRDIKNFKTVGRIIKGGLIEQEISPSLVKEGAISLVLNTPDFITCSRIVKAINEKFPDSAKARDASLIDIKLPVDFTDNIVGFIAEIDTLTVVPNIETRVVVNERTATVVMGENVKISQVCVSHGNLSLVVGEEKKLIGAQRVQELPQSVSVKDIVDALNSIGAAPRDIIAILQAIKEAGALHAELQVM
ncbi:MAG: flagellar basal body P-ring protein FlgI [bacterium]|nr:flagellar basal body P-ring protein FlgI [bacterium]